MTQIADKIKKNRLQLSFNDPFLAMLAVITEFKEAEVGTMCTDGTVIKYDPKFVSELTNGECLFVMCHELLHIILGHAYRGKEINAKPKLWNIACDMVVNRTILTRSYQGNIKNILGIPPKGIIMCPRAYEKLTTEEIYERLCRENSGSSLCNGASNILSDDLEEPKNQDSTSQSVEQLKKQHKDLLDKVCSTFKDCGVGLEELSRLVEDLRAPELDWRVLLRKYVTSYIKSDYSWARPNRRYTNMYLPSISGMSPELKTMNVYIDVSGSVKDEQVKSFMSEIKSIYNTFKMSKIKIYGFSTKLSEPVVITTKWINNSKFSTTGGTDIKPVVNHINSDKAKLNLIFTDGFFDRSPVDMLKGNIFWVIYDNPKYVPSKGRVSHL